MHIHKINSTSQEHQNFLAQNRKDPITGDSILEGDEVVFCASCKSIFLKDTWEYLGNRHCEQSETLSDFPLSSVILDLAKEDIFFYTFIMAIDEGQNSIPDLYGSKWKIKTRELSEYHDLFNGALFILIIALGFLVSVIIVYVSQNPFALLGGCVFLLIALISKHLHNSINGENLDSIHRKFTDNVFFISNLGIGFSNNYGMKEHTLSANHIKSLEFNFGKGTFTSINECVIKYKNGKKTTFYIRNFFKEKRPKRFLRALHKLNEKHAVQIHIKVSKNSHYQSAADFINSNQSKITISIQ
jgi:hypothetical protein